MTNQNTNCLKGFLVITTKKPLFKTFVVGSEAYPCKTLIDHKIILSSLL